MKALRMAGLSFLVVLLLAASVFAALQAWDRAHTLYPTPETESAFFKNYSPQQVIEYFDSIDSSGVLQHSGGTAGDKFVPHSACFELFFVMSSGKSTLLMAALRDDAAAQLVSNGAQILSQTGDAASGFHFDYTLGKSKGSLTILPLEITSPSLVHRATPLHEGMADMTARIEQTETWFPEGRAASE
jgi:hypothetical protein